MHSVLVVDDDHALRRTVSSWIESSGYDVQEAETAEHALEAMEERAQQTSRSATSAWPARTACGCAWRLRERHPQTAIILATALRDCETAVSSLRNDVVDYLLKPFDRGRLLEALSLGRDWHAAAAGDDELHQALQDRLRTRRAALAALAGRSADHARRRARRPDLDAAAPRARRPRARHARGAADAGAGRRTRRVQREPRCSSSNTARCCTTSASSTCPSAILTKSAPLDDDEWEVMRTASAGRL